MQCSQVLGFEGKQGAQLEGGRLRQGSGNLSSECVGTGGEIHTYLSCKGGEVSDGEDELWGVGGRYNIGGKGWGCWEGCAKEVGALNSEEYGVVVRVGSM